MKCDFCSERPVRWRYPARSFVMGHTGELGHESVGDWAACETCHDLIEADQRTALTARSLEQYANMTAALTEDQKAQLTALLTEAHNRFFNHRTGPAEPYVEGGDD